VPLFKRKKIEKKEREKTIGCTSFEQPPCPLCAVPVVTEFENARGSRQRIIEPGGPVIKARYQRKGKVARLYHLGRGELRNGTLHLGSTILTPVLTNAATVSCMVLSVNKIQDPNPPAKQHRLGHLDWYFLPVKPSAALSRQTHGSECVRQDVEHHHQKPWVKEAKPERRVRNDRSKVDGGDYKIR